MTVWEGNPGPSRSSCLGIVYTARSMKCVLRVLSSIEISAPHSLPGYSNILPTLFSKWNASLICPIFLMPLGHWPWHRVSKNLSNDVWSQVKWHTIFSQRNATFKNLCFFWRRVYIRVLYIHHKAKHNQYQVPKKCYPVRVLACTEASGRSSPKVHGSILCYKSILLAAELECEFHPVGRSCLLECSRTWLMYLMVW